VQLWWRTRDSISRIGSRVTRCEMRQRKQPSGFAYSEQRRSYFRTEDRNSIPNAISISTSNSFPNIGASHVYGHGSLNRHCLLYISPASINGAAEGNHRMLAPSTPFVACWCPSRKAHSANLCPVPPYLNSPRSRRAHFIPSLQIQHFFYRTQRPITHLPLSGP